MQLIDATKWFRPLRKNLGKKNCELGPEDIERICRTFLDFEETEESRIFAKEAFGVLEGDGGAAVEARGGAVGGAAGGVLRCVHRRGRGEAWGTRCTRWASGLGSGPHLDFNAFLAEAKDEMRGLGVRVTAKRRKLLRTALARRDEAAEPVVKRKHRGYVPADPIRGLFEGAAERQAAVRGVRAGSQAAGHGADSAHGGGGGSRDFCGARSCRTPMDAWYAPRSVKGRLRDQLQPVLLQARADAVAGGDRGGHSGGGEGDGGAAGRGWCPTWGRTGYAAAPWTTGGLAVRERPPRTAKLRVYVDTSVIGGCEDEEFRGPSRRLVERCMRGEVKTRGLGRHRGGDSGGLHHRSARCCGPSIRSIWRGSR